MSKYGHKVKVKTLGYLKLISDKTEIVIEETDGKETIAKASDLFTSYISSGFEKFDQTCKHTKETKIQVFEVINNGTFKQIFESLGENLDKLCLTQSQIIKFVRNHKRWLQTEDYGTFFLFKKKGEYFVVRVGLGGNGWRVLFCIFNSDHVWGAGYQYRLVIPQMQK